MSRMPAVADLAAGVLAGDASVLAQAITLVESQRGDHRELAQELLTEVLPHAGGALRLGVSGVPGVGKSTFLDAFGMHLHGLGLKVAALAVDPSSSVSGGSILGDKARMHRLAQADSAFIRPSPSGNSLGGVAQRTRESLLLCEAAGFDVVLVETVGVGQSETTVAQMVDCFLVLMLPGAGDELQGIKKGIIELADILAVNKADGSNVDRAAVACKDYRAALHYLPPKWEGWTRPVQSISALEETGLEELWQAVLEHRQVLQESGELQAMRREQNRAWLWSQLEEQLLERFRRHPIVSSTLPQLEQSVLDGLCPPALAAGRLLDDFLRRPQ